MSRYWEAADFEGKTKQEIQQHLDLQAELTKVETDRFMRNNQAYPAWDSLMHALGAGQRGVRTVISSGLGKAAGLGLADAHWASEEAKDFRYNSLPLFHGYATFVHSSLGELKKGGALLPGGVAGIMLRAAQETDKQGKLGFPWAHDNPEWVESAAMTTLDPMWAASYVSGLAKFAWAAPEIKALAPFAKAAVEAGSHAEVIAALKPLWGRDVASPLFYKALQETAQLNPTKVAEFLYHNGLRSSEWAKTAAMPITAVFKRGGQIASPKAMETLRGIFGGSLKSGEAVSQILAKPEHGSVDAIWKPLTESMQREFTAAYAALPDVTQAEKATINWLEHNIPRIGETHELRMKSFRDYYQQAASPAGLRIEGHPEVIRAPLLDAATLQKAEAYIGHLSAGYLDGTGYKNTYGVSKVVADKINAGLREAAETMDNLAEKGWRLPRRGTTGMIDAIDNFKTWHASTFTREKFAKGLADVTATLLERARVMEEAGLKPDAEIMRHAAEAVTNFAKQPDFVNYGARWSEMSKMEKSGVVAKAGLEAYMKGLRWAKAAMLRPNPGFLVHRFFDMAGFRSLIETGDTVMTKALRAMYEGEAVPAMTIQGTGIDFSRHAAEVQFGLANPTTWFGKVGQFLNKGIEAIDNTALNHIGKFHYDHVAGEALRAGHSFEVAHDMGMRAAAGAADLVHGLYTSRSPAMNAMRYGFMFPEHFLGRATHLLTRMLQHPAESYGLLKLEERRQQIGAGRNGEIQIPGTQRSWDPLNNTVPGQITSSLLQGDRILNSQDRFEWKVAKGMSLLTGSMTPPVAWMARAAGVFPPAHNGELTAVENIADTIGRAMGADLNTPSDMVSSLMGGDPGETKSVAAQRRSAMVTAAAKISGGDVTPEQASHQSSVEDVKTALIKWGLGQTTQYNPPGMPEAREAALHYREEMEKIAPELRPALRQVLVNEPHLLIMENVGALAKDPAARFAALQFMDNREEANIRRYLEDPKTRSDYGAGKFTPFVEPTDKEKGDRLQILEDHIKASPIFKLLSALTPDAGAATIDTEKTKATTPVNFIKGANGHAVVAPGGDATYEQKASAQKRWQEDSVALAAQPSLTAIHAYVKNSEDPATGYNPVLTGLTNMQKVDSEADRYLQAYRAIEVPGSVPLASSMPSNIGRTQIGIDKAYENLVASSKPAVARWLVNAKPEEIQAAISQGRIPAAALAVGTTALNYDPLAIKAAQQAATPFVFAAQKNYEDQRAKDFPGDLILRSRLQTAVDHQPQIAHQSVDRINEAVKNGFIEIAGEKVPVSKTFWNDLADSSRSKGSSNPGLYERAAIADDAPELTNLRNKISIVSKVTGKFLGVSIPAMLEAVEENPGNKARLIALRTGAAGPQFSSAMEAARANADPVNAAGFDHVAPIDQEYVGNAYQTDFGYRTGITQHPIVSALSDNLITPAAAAITNPFQRTEDGGIQRRTTVGEAMATAETSGGTLNLGPRGGGFLPGPATIAPSPIQTTVEMAQNIARTASFSGGGGGFSSIQTVVPPNLPYKSIAVRDLPYGSNAAGRQVNSGMVEWLTDGYNQSQATGRPLLTTLSDLAKTSNGQPSVNTYQAIGAINSLASTANNLAAGFDAEYSSSDVGRGISGALSGVGTGLGVYAGLAALGATGVGLPIAAVGVGIVAGLQAGGAFGGGSKSNGNSEEMLRLAKERQALEQAKFDEQLKQTSIRDLRSRESDAARAVGGFTPAQRAAIEPHLAAFSRRPTYGSRIGLVDQVERQLASSLKPTY